jgi:hypothetical protein
VGEARGNPSDGYEDEGRAALGGYSGGEQGQRPPWLWWIGFGSTAAAEWRTSGAGGGRGRRSGGVRFEGRMMYVAWVCIGEANRCSKTMTAAADAESQTWKQRSRQRSARPHALRKVGFQFVLPSSSIPPLSDLSFVDLERVHVLSQTDEFVTEISIYKLLHFRFLCFSSRSLSTLAWYYTVPVVLCPH